MSRSVVGLAGLVCFLVGLVAGQQLPYVYGQEAKAKAPQWLHGLDLKARKGGEVEFKDARKYGIEVFRDENNNNLVYISETGSIAVVPAR